MSIISPTQSREARRELGISQADVATALGISRPYISDFESGNLIRLTNNQLRKLRSHYEEKIAAAKEAGDEIEIFFGDSTPEVVSIRAQSFTEKNLVFGSSNDASDDVVSSVMATIADNDKELSAILNLIATRDHAIFGEGGLSEETLSNLRQAFSLLAGNYLLVRSIGGWPEIGLSAANMNIADNSLLQLVIKNAEQQFIHAGLIGIDQQEKKGGAA